MKNMRDKRTYLMIGLFVLLIVMAVGFAAFAQQLQINSTSEVTANWDVHIKDNGVSYRDAVGATSTLAEKTSALVATFACTLSTPGTSTISYDIIVENTGSLNANLDGINLTGGNSAISVVTSPTNASLANNPIVLGPNDETTITVVVSYNDILTQPTGDGASTNITVTLDFSQTNNPSTVSGGSGGGSSSTEIVYAHHTTRKCFTDECEESEGYSRTVTDGVSNYTQLSSYQNGKTWFLKYEIDSTTNEIQNAWACQYFSSISDIVCLRASETEDSSDPNQYRTENISTVSSIISRFNGFQSAGSTRICTTNMGDDKIYCAVDDYYASSFLNPNLNDSEVMETLTRNHLYVEGGIYSSVTSGGDNGNCYVVYEGYTVCNG